MTDPERRRRRPAVSCTLCRRRKIRCNRETPCSNCMRSRNGACIYETHPSQPLQQHLGQGQASEPNPAQKSLEAISINETTNTSRESTVPRHPSSSLVSKSTDVSSPASQLSSTEVESIKIKIRQLEEQLSGVTPNPLHSPSSNSNSKIEISTSRLGGTLYLHQDNCFHGQSHAITRGITHKTRLFGQSHWVNGIALLMDNIKTIELYRRDDLSRVFSGIQRCKSLAKAIKSQRSPRWPVAPTSDLPTKDIADELVERYLVTIETVYRILHVPTFRRDYEALWIPDTERDISFLVQLKLVLAIGATTYDEKFSLRSSAMKWVYEAQAWLSEPKYKSRLGIQSLQTNILLLLAQDIVGGDSIWISAGALLRRAVYMGLHRDPVYLPKRTIFAAEMRRRLWNTILEIILQSSLTSGGPPFISLNDFDTEPPGNFDDDQLLTEDPVEKPDDSFTQVSIAIALRKTLPLRLAVTKFLNDLGAHGTYEETLQLDAELRASYKTLCRALQGCNSSNGTFSNRFAIRAVDFIMHRYISSLHVPFFSPGFLETTYAFSRKVVVESSLKIWYAVHPLSSIKIAPVSHSDTDSSEGGDFTRFTTCGSGFFRTVAFQAVLLIAMELRAQLQENESLGLLPLRPDLLSVLNDTKTWCLKCIEAGEVNIKGYLLIRTVSAQIDGLMRGLAKEEIPELVVKAAEDAQAKCLQILEEMAAQSEAEGATHNLHQMSLNATPEAIEDWDFMMNDSMLNSDDAELMNWMLNDETMQELSLW